MRKGKQVVVLMMAFIILMGTFNVAYVDDRKSTVEAFIKENVSVGSNGKIIYNNKAVRANVSEKSTGEFNRPVVIDGEKNVVVFYSSESANKLYREAKKVQENERVGEKVGDITGGMRVEADTGAATTMLSGFLPILEIIIGIIAVLIIFGMTFFSALDISYIAFPVLRNKLEDAANQSKGGEMALRWVTDDAKYAVSQGTIESGKSPWALYFKKRIGSYIFLAITLFILLTGNISIITDIAVNLVAGIVDLLSELAS